jgi:hypothetical protein
VAVLALLLIGYVFGGGQSRSGRTVDGPSRDLATSCSSRQTSELLKRDLFGRAAALRGRDQAAMAQAASYSVVRVASVTATKVDEGRGEVTCAATLAVDLPPQMAVVGGRRSLTGAAEYAVRGGSGGPPQLRFLSNPDAIVTPLAALTGVEGDAPATFDVQSPDANSDGNAVSARPDDSALPPPPVPSRAVPPPPPPAPRRVAAPAPARTEAARRPPPRQPEREVAAARPRPTQPAPAPPPKRPPRAASDTARCGQAAGRPPRA